MSKLTNLRSEATSQVRRQRRAYRLTLFLSDAAMVGIAFLLAYWLRFDFGLALQPEAPARPEFYLSFGVVLFPVWMTLFALFGLYNWDCLLGGTTEYARVFHACTTGVGVIVVATFLFPDFVVARGWLALLWPLSVALVVTIRWFWRRVVYALRERGFFRVPAIIIGANSEALHLCEQLRASRRSGLDVVGLINGLSRDANHLCTKAPLLGTLDDLEDLVQLYRIERVVVALTALDREELFLLYEKVSRIDHLELWLSSGLVEILTTGVRVKTLGPVTLMSLNKLRLDPLQQFSKTVFEYLLAVGGLIVLAPILAAIAFLIKIETPGPVLHRRRVIGIGGKEFDAFKFRTMYSDAAERLVASPDLEKCLRLEGKLKNDPRVTRLGWWLRRSSLDELPQLLNVLQGQMSLVGPRMISPDELEHYGQNKWNLVTVKPGMTGLWQVSGRSDLSYEERVRLDMHYIRNYSIWIDLQILLVQTPAAVFKGRGAY